LGQQEGQDGRTDIMIGPAAKETAGSRAAAILGELLGPQFIRKAVFIRD
jgi:hypothetical protein